MELCHNENPRLRDRLSHQLGSSPEGTAGSPVRFLTGPHPYCVWGLDSVI